MDPEKEERALRETAAMLFELICGAMILTMAFKPEELDQAFALIEEQLPTCPTPHIAESIREQLALLRRFHAQHEVELEAERFAQAIRHQSPPFSPN